jgi:hypothetical protein
LSSDLSADRAAAECLRTISRFLTWIDEVRIDGERVLDFGSEPPSSYTAALKRTKDILSNGANSLSDHVGAPIINPYYEPILKYEKEQLERHIRKTEEDYDQLRNATPEKKPGFWGKFKNGFKKVFNSADVILDSLESYVPGLKFATEFKKQLESLSQKGKEKN